MLTTLENQEICLVCRKPISLNKGEVGAITQRMNLMICTTCLIDLGPLEDKYFQIFYTLSDEIVRLRKKLKYLEPELEKDPVLETMTLDDYRR